MGEWTRDSMRRGVANADVIISVVSPKYMKSKNCGFEMALAAEMGKTIIPIMLGVPFEEWPPARIGETDMTGQYADAASGDMKLFVDFSKLADFDVKFWNELKPRLADASFVPTTSAAIREPPSAFFDLLNRCVTIRLRTLKRVPRFPIAHGIVLPLALQQRRCGPLQSIRLHGTCVALPPHPRFPAHPGRQVLCRVRPRGTVGKGAPIAGSKDVGSRDRADFGCDGAQVWRVARRISKELGPLRRPGECRSCSARKHRASHQKRAPRHIPGRSGGRRPSAWSEPASARAGFLPPAPAVIDRLERWWIP